MFQIETEEMVDIEKQNAILNIICLMETFDISLIEIEEKYNIASKYSMGISSIIVADERKFCRA